MIVVIAFHSLHKFLSWLPILSEFVPNTRVMPHDTRIVQRNFLRLGICMGIELEILPIDIYAINEIPIFSNCSNCE